MPHPYSVRLHDACDLSTAQRIEAETRLARSLENQLGGPTEVASVYRAWIDASEAQAIDLDTATAAQSVRWPLAFGTAQAFALRELGQDEGTHFVIRVAPAGATA